MGLDLLVIKRPIPTMAEHGPAEGSWPRQNPSRPPPSGFKWGMPGRYPVPPLPPPPFLLHPTVKDMHDLRPGQTSAPVVPAPLPPPATAVHAPCLVYRSPPAGPRRAPCSPPTPVVGGSRENPLSRIPAPPFAPPPSAWRPSSPPWSSRHCRAAHVPHGPEVPEITLGARRTQALGQGFCELRGRPGSILGQPFLRKAAICGVNFLGLLGFAVGGPGRPCSRKRARTR